MAKGTQKEESAAVPVSLDGKDLEILALLQDNARITVREIAERVHLTTTPVHERIRRLEESGVIRQYATLLDPAKLGKNLTVICYVSLREHTKNAGLKFIRTINEMHEILECYSISGEFDFMLKVVAKDMNAYYDFHVNKLSQIENMGHIQSVFVMGTVKQSHRLIYS